MTETVVVLGGGIGGLSAAHELVEREYEVEVYEKRPIFGGKARSVDVPGTAGEETKPLPGEHGFRFFPAFYRHVFDTMRRIPYEDNEEGVFDNLVETTQWLIAREGDAEVELPLDLPGMIEEWDTVIETLVGTELDIPPEEQRFFADRLLTFLSSCEERREAEYEHLPWWEFVEAEGKSEAYRRFYGVGPTRVLVAMQAEKSSTRTIGRIYAQLLLGIAMPWLHVDSVLDGPTNDVWIDPWVEYLREQGVTFHSGAELRGFGLDDGHVSHVEVATDDGERTASGDYYVAAVPVEVMADLLTDELVEAAPSLADLDRLRTAWMNGIQFYLDEPVPIAHGHVVYEDAAWALTSISQQEFWDDVDLSEYGDGDVESIISLCISDWETEGETVGKPAKECTPVEIKREVWAQMTARLNDAGKETLDEDAIVTWHLDPDIEFPAPNETTNAEPLLINTVGSLEHRPEADLAVPNLFLAADYVRTHTDLATMEAANEAARRAVNGIIAASGDEQPRCDVWPLEEPSVFEPMKAYDRLRFEMGLPHRDLGPTDSLEG